MADVTGVVLAHGELASALVATVRRIAGEDGGLVPVSNEGIGPEELRERVHRAAGAGPAVVFADLASGSCALASRLAASDRADTVVITGVNLPVLLDFVFHRDLPLADLATRLVERGRRGLESWGSSHDEDGQCP